MNTTSLMVIQPDELDTIQRTGRLLAASGYFDAKGEGSQAIAQMATKIIAGREMGIGPFASVNGIHIISGKPAIGANLQAAAVKSSGRYDYRVRELTDKVCKIEFLERTGDKWESLGISEFTYADGVKAQTKNLDKFPKNMLFARAMSNGVRFYVPDVFNGNAVYVPEELGAEVDGDGNVIDVTPRQVEPSTDEILDGKAADNPVEDVSFEKPKPPVLSDEQLQQLNIVGRKFYGNTEWETVRPTLVQAVSKGAISSATELTPSEAVKLIKGIQRKMKEAEETAVVK